MGADSSFVLASIAWVESCIAVMTNMKCSSAMTTNLRLFLKAFGP